MNEPSVQEKRLRSGLVLYDLLRGVQRPTVLPCLKKGCRSAICEGGSLLRGKLIQQEDGGVFGILRRLLFSFIPGDHRLRVEDRCLLPQRVGTLLGEVMKDAYPGFSVARFQG